MSSMVCHIMAIRVGSPVMRLRTRLGLSQQVLAEKMGVSRQTVSTWERTGMIPVDRFVDLSNALECTIREVAIAVAETIELNQHRKIATGDPE
jgi:transcriptional regulator with XRE-family HTH domain